MLKNIIDSQSAGIKLIKPDVTKKFYQIASENDIFATIDLIHGQGSLARIEVPSGSYTIKRQGFFAPYVTLRKENDNQDVANIFIDIYGRSFLNVEGTSCSFKPLALWKNHWGWVNDKNKCIVKFMLTSSGLVRGDLEFSKDFFYLQNLELLAALGAYLLLQLEDEVSANSSSKSL